MVKILEKILALWIILLCTVSCIQENEPVAADLQTGDPIPDFTVMMNDGSTVSAEQLRTGTALIVFFHTGCPDCQQTLPSVQKIYDEYKGEIGFALISREQGGDEIAAYWENKGYTMPYSAQTDRTVYHLFASSRVPRVYVCNNGFVKYTYDDSPIPSYSDLKGNMESF